MALAILELLAFEKANVRFKIDTGTNRYYRLKIGRNIRRRYGIDWVDEVYYSTHVSTNEMGGELLNSSSEIAIPVSSFEKGDAYVQLFSFKTPAGKSPALSRVVKVPMGFSVQSPMDFALSLYRYRTASMNMTDSFHPSRKIAHAEVYTYQASLEDLLSGIVKIAGPMVLNLIGGGQNEPQQSASLGPSGSDGNAGQTDVLALLLKKILGNILGNTGSPASRQQSLIGPDVHTNRFLNMRNAQFSQPFFLPVLMPLLQAVAGPLVQVLPQLMNAANQRRVQMKQADNKLVSDVLSEVNRRMLLEQLLQAQRQAPSGGQPANAADLSQLIQLLQQATSAPPQTTEGAAPQPPATAASTTQSLSLDARHSSTLNSKAMVSFVTADPVLWNGMQKILFVKNQGLHLKIRLNVAEPVPKIPLPKAILRFVFKNGSNQSIWHEKTFKQKAVLPNSVMSFPFSPDELNHLPVNKPISVFAEMRWLSSMTGREYKAMGSSEIVLVNKYFLKGQGKDVSMEQELTDMKRFRPFWNKVWEAPTIDTVGSKSDGGKKYLWDLNVNAKYSILLTADHEANGLMETKINREQREQADDEGLAERTEGRMKAGIEMSITELNKLVPLWEDKPSLDRDRLEAFETDSFVKNNAGEFIYNFKLKGRSGERGMIWVVPIFKLFDFTLNTVQKTDDAGQVIAVDEEKAQFPLPVSVRVIGLKSNK